MFPRFVKLALVSFLSITALLGAHHYHSHSQAQQVISETERLDAAKQGSPTFFGTNPFGLPGADQSVRALSDSGSRAASYGLTPPTSYKALSDQTVAQPTSNRNYVGLLGLLGLLGFVSRSRNAPS
ncbi:hypothetical protein [Paenibacillus sedimenti]|uniref:Uncharacterized protein n=1 Tax=Paenibacillus sedimenti TaxID=2770274 RepID=A0A926KSK7_9BACL|nr:hypothetical protein [Paenibacillus sedimenti]MBD0382548.1 hypothetical protein [Paenibacillus sedimenti]